jgi:Ser/Thr protein kinase RdoA (MazF antagonist)
MLQDSSVSLVLSRYPSRLQPVSLIRRLGNAGGTSGAKLWSYRAEDGEMLLRAWPRHGPTLARLELIHGWIREVAALDDVPVPVPVQAIDGRTVQQHDALYWEVAPWLAGAPESRRPPPAARVQAAYAALAAVHRRLSGYAHRRASPGLRLRIGELEKLAAGGLEFMAAALERSQADPLCVPGRRWVSLARSTIPKLLPSLHDAARLQVVLQPCLRDARPEHFLFEHERLSGLIDFGAMGIESVAADLARLIGEWFAEDHSLRALGLEAYQHVRLLDASELALISALEATGDLLIAGHWLSWHFLGPDRFDDAGEVAGGVARGLDRLERLVERITPGGLVV